MRILLATLLATAVAAAPVAWRTYGTPGSPPIFFVPGGAGLPFPDDYFDPIAPHAFVVTYDPCSVGRSRDCPRARRASSSTTPLPPRPRRRTACARSRSPATGGCLWRPSCHARANARALLLVSPVADFPRARPLTEKCAREALWLPQYAYDLLPRSVRFVAEQVLCGYYCARAGSPWTCGPSTTDVRTLGEYWPQRLAVLDEYYTLSLRGTFACKVVVLAGAYDRVAPLELVDEAVRTRTLRSDHVHLVVVPRAAHHIRYEDEARFVDGVREALA